MRYRLPRRKPLPGLQAFIDGRPAPEPTPAPSGPDKGLPALLRGGYDDDAVEWSTRQLEIVHALVFFVLNGGTGTPRPGAGSLAVIAELLAEVESTAAVEEGGLPEGRNVVTPEP